MKKIIDQAKCYSLLVGLFTALGSDAQQPATLPPSYPVGLPVNYVRSWNAVKPETNAANITTASQPADHRMMTQYVDGLGRPLQTVLKQASMNTYGGTAVTADLVNPAVYDEYGREVVKYLPFAAVGTDGMLKTNPFQQQVAFYNGQLSGQAGETYVGTNGLNWAYNQSVLEASPLSRPLEVFAPGGGWVGTTSQAIESARRSVKTKYYLNTSTDQVVIWEGNIPSGFYNPGELYKTVAVDEHGKQVIEFKDKLGNVVLKKVQLTGTADSGTGIGYTGWLCTYYIYDVWNKLNYVIQPVGVQRLYENSWPTPTASAGLWAEILNEQCFQYAYDDRNRMIMKKVPGAGPTYMVYDARDRVVLMQDANLQNGSPVKWLYTKYDDLDRIIQTGLWDNNSSQSTHALAAAASTSYPNLTGQTYTVLSETFYDNYNWLAANGNPFSPSRSTDDDAAFYTPSNSNFPYPQPLNQSSKLNGLVTGTRVRVLGTSQFLFSINYYDDESRVLQNIAHNIAGGSIVTTNQYSFSGQLLASYQRTNITGSGATQRHKIRTRNDYDVLGRIVAIKKEVFTDNGVGNTGEKTVVQYEYDALGRIKQKKLAPYLNSGNGLENQVTDYNIRDWVLGMNRNYLEGTAAAFFGYELGYDKLGNKSGKDFLAGSNSGEFNGNINGMVWKSKGDGVSRKYDFEYDGANRVLRGDYEQKDGANWGNGTMNYSVKMGDGTNPASAYDPNGNILGMTQYGWKLGGSSSTPIDLLSYVYSSNSNKLDRVTDAQNDPNTKLGDFHDGSNAAGTSDYSYDWNGNLTVDKNKDISAITYNHLNLPSLITVTGKGTVEYTYDAAGSKLKKVVTDQTVIPNKITTTVYAGGSVYENNELKFSNMEEGQIRFAKATAITCPSPLADRFVFDYFVKDHLGNVRMVLTDQQENICYIPATVEDSRYTTEDDYYDIVNGRRVDKTVAGAGSQASFESKVYRVHGGLANEKTGLGITLKVMSGDQVRITAESFYTLPGGGAGSPATVALTELLTAFAGSPALAAAGHGGTTATAISGAGNNSSSLSLFLGGQAEGSNNARAFVNWMLFDEQFRFVGGSSDPVKPGGGYKLHTAFTDLPVLVTKSGYLYIYVSNESNLPVFFDNLGVTHIPGPLREEDHYYPFGLTMAGISSKALSFGGPENKYKYNGIEHNDAFDINTYDAFYRNLDPQIGRFWQIDPKPNEKFSPYAAMANNPILYSDPLGDTTWVYGSTGRYLGVVGDNLPNQVHFLGHEGGKTPFDASKLSLEAATKLGESFRGLSVAFMGANTAADMEKIASSADSKGFEMAFVAEVSESKELRLTALPDKYRKGDNQYDLIGAIEETYKDKKGTFFAAGHAHNKKHVADQTGYDGYSGDMAKFLKLNTPSTRAGGEKTYPDFQPVLGRQTPAFIVSAYGFTIYGTGTGYGGLNNTVQNPVLPNEYKSYMNYKQIKK
ncbi:MAG: hypothetical protein DI535_05870 [Citrobacter freundii]|nr:MAG: hypothetical protein DI535_05870 [Citrobacter freundii]